VQVCNDVVWVVCGVASLLACLCWTIVACPSLCSCVSACVCANLLAHVDLVLACALFACEHLLDFA